MRGLCYLLLAMLFPALAHGGETIVLDLYDEVVCRVNTEAVSKRQVEEQMQEIVIKLYIWKKQLESAGQWTEQTEKQWNDLYIPPFRDALRRVVRDRLMLQSAKLSDVKVDEINLQKQVNATVARLKAQGVFGGSGFTLGEVKKRVRESMLIDNYRFQHIASFLDNPSRPEVTEYYQKNIQRYQRKPGVKVRLIRIDRFVTNKITGKQSVREDAHEQATRLREDIVRYNADFKEVARQHSDDEESRSRGGLLMLDPKDPFIDPESYNAQLASAVRGLQLGEPEKAVSKVFELGNSWAITCIEEKREAGPMPLEGELYDEIYKTLLTQKTKKKEDEWMRKALKNNLVEHVVEGNPKPLPVEFFFPDDAKEPKPAEASKDTKKETSAK